jgi:KipI family sensor histidine kinase inhibitor
MNSNYPKIQVAGENSLIIYFSDQPSPQLSDTIAATLSNLQTALGDQLIDLVPSYASLLVIYDPLLTDHYAVRKAIRHTLSNHHTDQALEAGGSVELPVYYSVESGPDLQQLADNAGLSIDQVIALHQQTEYRVYAIGFAPGFAYLGEVDPKIAAPRLATPRQKVPQGAVAIADRQTAVYPAPSPGGWNLIGLCPTPMFNPNKVPTMPVKVGDTVRFSAIDRDQFLQLGGSESDLCSEFL